MSVDTHEVEESSEERRSTTSWGENTFVLRRRQAQRPLLRDPDPAKETALEHPLQSGRLIRNVTIVERAQCSSKRRPSPIDSTRSLSSALRPVAVPPSPKYGHTPVLKTIIVAGPTPHVTCPLSISGAAEIDLRRAERAARRSQTKLPASLDADLPSTGSLSSSPSLPSGPTQTYSESSRSYAICPLSLACNDCCWHPV